MAIENPGILFYVKTKWAGTWFDRIKSTILNNVGLDIKDLPNLILDSEEDAQSLIERSSIVVAFNSTTVLETGLMGKKFILPIFCEAKEKYYNSNVFFREFLELLPTASSKEDLKNKIISFKSDNYKNKIPEDMINKFIYAFDGKSGERILNEI